VSLAYILRAVLHPLRQGFDGHLGLLHLSLSLRVGGDLAGWWPGQQWEGLFNDMALLLLLTNTELAICRGSEQG
jgi:hypothetical protein